MDLVIRELVDSDRAFLRKMLGAALYWRPDRHRRTGISPKRTTATAMSIRRRRSS
jgi:hypothetical protein